MTVRNGAPTAGHIGGFNGVEMPEDLLGTRLHEIGSWDEFIRAWMKGSNVLESDGQRAKLVNWLTQMLPTALIDRTK